MNLKKLAVQYQITRIADRMKHYVLATVFILAINSIKYLRDAHCANVALLDFLTSILCSVHESSSKRSTLLLPMLAMLRWFNWRVSAVELELPTRAW